MAICQLFFHEVQGTVPEGLDLSQFAASRKPTVGRISPDRFFQNLTNSPQGAWIISQAIRNAKQKADEGGYVEDMAANIESLIDDKSKEYLTEAKQSERQSIISQIKDALGELGTT